MFDSDKQAEVVGISVRENKRTRKYIEASPERYLALPRLTQRFMNKMIRAFIDSEWTDDVELRAFARLAYDGSVNRWKKRLSSEILLVFDLYEIRYLLPTVADFLRAHAVEPKWI